MLFPFRPFNKLPSFILLIVLFFPSAGQAAAREKSFKNVIILMADGTGSAHTTIARWYLGKPLNLDRMHLGGVRTHSAESLISDSAPAATAFATGYKSNAKLIGVLPEKAALPGADLTLSDRKHWPVANVLEGAKLQGKSVGLVATSNIQHASPAAYSAHWPRRNDFQTIGKQQVYLGLDVVLGGGKKFLLPKSAGGERSDNEDLIEVLKSRGWKVVETREQLQKVKGPQVWGLFAPNDLAYDWDRPRLAPQEPSLAEMTGKALELLSGNKKGFFLFVEGSKVDWASHANDPIGVISDLLAFDQAVGAALDFAQKNRPTLVLAFSDHGNGGMSLGNRSTDRSYDTLPLEQLLVPLKKAVLTGEGVERILKGSREADRIIKVVREYYGIDDLSEEEVVRIQESKKGFMNDVLGPMLSRRSPVGWTTRGHTGEDLFFYHYGLNRPLGMIDNTQIARITARVLGFRLETITRRLFVPAEPALRKMGADWGIDQTDPANPVLHISRGSFNASLPMNKNILLFGDRVIPFFGLTLRMPTTEEIFLPREALDRIRKLIQPDRSSK